MNVIDLYGGIALLLMLAGSFCLVLGAENYSKRFFKYAGIVVLTYIAIRMFVSH